AACPPATASTAGPKGSSPTIASRPRKGEPEHRASRCKREAFSLLNLAEYIDQVSLPKSLDKKKGL
ncbi:MAG: hypothetical protein Q8P82_03035, partial [bacterium]|nr:hypothetical protein [bacterium]